MVAWRNMDTNTQSDWHKDLEELEDNFSKIMSELHTLIEDVVEKKSDLNPGKVLLFAMQTSYNLHFRLRTLSTVNFLLEKKIEQLISKTEADR